MSTELRHIKRIESTNALFYANGDSGQSAITTDSSDWEYFDDGGTELYKLARQSYYDGSTTYLDNDFNQVTLHSDLLVSEYIKRNGGTDDSIRFQNDTITIAAGGVNTLVVEDDKATVLSSFYINESNAASALYLQRIDATVAANDVIATIEWLGGESSTNTVSKIATIADGDWVGSTEWTTRMVFYVADSDTSSLVEAVTIDPTRSVGIGNFGTANVLTKLHIKDGAPYITLESVDTTVIEDQVLGGILYRAGEVTPQTVAANYCVATADFDASNFGTRFEWWIVTTGGSTLSKRMSLVENTFSLNGVADFKLTIDAVNSGPEIRLYREDSDVSSGNIIGDIQWVSGESSVATNAMIRVIAAENYTASSSPTTIEFYTTPSGSTTDALAVSIDSTKKLSVFGGTDSFAAFDDNDMTGAYIATNNVDAYSTSPKTGVYFSLQYDSSNTIGKLSGVGGGKENATDGNFAGYTALYTKPNGGSMTEQLRVASDGGIYLYNVKTGTTEGGAGASTSEIWVDTDNANTLKLKTT